MESLSLNKYAQILIKRWQIIGWFVLGFLLLSILFSTLMYTPAYTSKSKVLIKQNIPTTFITELRTDTQMSSLGQNKNPVLNQIEVLSSLDLSMEAAKKLSKDINFSDYRTNILGRMINRQIKLDTPVGTDVVQIEVIWNNPQDSQKINKALLEAYYDYNVEVNKQSVMQTKQYINKQLDDSTKALENLRNEIKKYRKANLTVNIEMESNALIQQSQRVESLIVDADANISSQKSKYKQLIKNLGVDLQKAVDAVATGGDANLVKLQQNLQDAQQRYAAMKVKYPVTTPEMKSLAANIEEIQGQISDATVALIGKSSGSNANLISDPVRLKMVGDAVESNTALKSSIAQKQELLRINEEMNQNLKKMPDKQKTLSSLLEKEATLAAIVSTLNTKLIEANIKESEIISNITNVQSPTLPMSESFPTRIHIILMFLFSGFILGVGTVLGLYYIDDICEGSSELEDILKAPVLGVIPWLTSGTYNNFMTDYNPQSVVAIIYQKIAASVKVKCYKKKINAIGIISAELEKRRSIVTASLANTLIKSDDRVLLLDMDFRDGSLTREFNIDFSNYPDMTDMIMELPKCVENPSSCADIIKKYIIPIPEHKNLYIIPNNNKVENPYALLNNEIFSALMLQLKANFDFVLVDTPPMLAVADSILTAQHLDGFVVLCGIKTSRQNLRKIKKLCDENFVEIMGTIARNTLTELEVPENMYIKQFSSKEI